MSASEIGLIHLVVMPLLFLSLIITAFRPTNNGRAGLAVGLAMRAWVLLFFRGLLGIHTGDPHALGLSGVLIGTVLIVLWYRLRRQPQIPRLPPKRAWLGRTRTWLFILLSIVIMLFFALLVQIFVVQTLALLGIAGGFVAWRRRRNATLPAQVPT